MIKTIDPAPLPVLAMDMEGTLNDIVRFERESLLNGNPFAKTAKDALPAQAKDVDVERDPRMAIAAE